MRMRQLSVAAKPAITNKNSAGMKKNSTANAHRQPTLYRTSGGRFTRYILKTPNFG